MSRYHTSVLLTEVIEMLHVQRGEQYIDATVGGGGHTEKILAIGGKVLGIDVDQEALDFCKEKFGGQNLVLVKGNFRTIDTIAREKGFLHVRGILFDFGVSSHQIDDKERGFSFQQSSPLDMRMDTTLSVRAKDLLNGLHKQELLEVFRRFGEERFAHGIAMEIIKRRKEGIIFETTDQLQEVIYRLMPAKLDRIGATARIFQSLRIIVNDELHAIEEALPKALELLQTNGRLIAISFHSLEDRIVKQTFAAFAKEERGRIITSHPISATAQEMTQNSRSRSAKMRVFEKI